ncbi:MAG: GTP cyclohydrolase I [Gemmatimonadota bacterium]
MTRSMITSSEWRMSSARGSSVNSPRGSTDANLTTIIADAVRAGLTWHERRCRACSGGFPASRRATACPHHSVVSRVSRVVRSRPRRSDSGGHRSARSRRLSRAAGRSGGRCGARTRRVSNTEGHSGIVQVSGIPFYSICAHHFLPFFGVAQVGYVPGERLVGLSKLGRVVDFCARRPQLQEHLTEQIATFLDQRIAPRGIVVVLEGRHMCMEIRGLSRPNLTTTTTAVRGVLEDGRKQQQFYSRLRGTDARTAPQEI